MPRALTAEMKRLNLNQSTLAAKAGCSQPAISTILAGRSKRPSLELIVGLADALNVSVDRLLGRSAKGRVAAGASIESRVAALERSAFTDRPPSDHLRIDARELAMHRAIASKIERDPSLLSKALANVGKWRRAPGVRSHVQEWEEILALPLREVLDFISEDTPDARRLRQSSPFAGILSSEERLAIHDAFRTRAHHTRGR